MHATLHGQPNLHRSHKFARGATSGKGSRVFIEGNKIYSFGHHFVLATRKEEGDWGCGVKFIVNGDRYSPAQMYAAGFYVNQSKGGDGLPAWTQASRSIENRDIVLWYTMGITHIPRPEDWPVMPVHRAGFKLVPSGFFDQNPTIDVPR